MVGGGVNEPREVEAVCAGGSRSGKAEEVTEPRLDLAGWVPWKADGPGSSGISKEAAGT